MLRGSMRINAKHHLEIGGCDVCDLASLVPHPLYILDEILLRANMRAYSSALKLHYGPNSEVYYASKALINLALCKIAQKEGIGLDVASGGELSTALKAHFPMERVIFHGNNKSVEELELALKNGVSRLIIDNRDEAHLLHQLCHTMQKRCDVLVRIKPGISAHTHQYIMTGTEDSKFGLNITDGSALEVIQFLHTTSCLTFKGVHCHIGSQIHNLEAYEKTVEVMADFTHSLAKQGVTIADFDFGGGLGIAYTAEDQPVSIMRYIETISNKLIKEFTQRGLPLPRLMLEPGRSIVGEAGTTLYRIGALKPSTNKRIDAAINGGMADNIRPALYQAKYHAVLANRLNEQADSAVRIVGKCCESSDILIEEISLPKPCSGDILAVFSTGAYNYSMASNYNRLPIPGMLLVNQGSYDWIVRPQSHEDISHNDLVPNRL